ncbi:MAG: hypothetical protein AAFQ82_07070 [Myxococcota bacterium]
MSHHRSPPSRIRECIDLDYEVRRGKKVIRLCKTLSEAERVRDEHQSYRKGHSSVLIYPVVAS